MKKILLTLGAAASVAAPIAAVISCGSKTTTTTGGNGSNGGNGSDGTGDGSGGGDVDLQHPFIIRQAQTTSTGHRLTVVVDAIAFVDKFKPEHVHAFQTEVLRYHYANPDFDFVNASEVVVKATVNHVTKFYQVFVKPGTISDLDALTHAMENMAPPTLSAPVMGEVVDVSMATLNAEIGKVPNAVDSDKMHEALYAIKQIREGKNQIVNWEQIGISPDTYHPISGTAFSIRVKSPLGVLDDRFTVEFKLFSIADSSKFVAKDVVITEEDAAVAAPLVDLTFAHESEWHALFRGQATNHRKLPQIDQTLYVDVEGTNYGFTWTAADSKFPIMISYLHHDVTQKAVLNYLAQRIIAANPSAHITKAQVFASFGDAMINPTHINIAEDTPDYQNVPTTGLKAGVTLPSIIHEMVEITGDPTQIQTSWHKLFSDVNSLGVRGRSLPKVGTTLYMTDAHGKNYGFTWTNEDSMHEIMRKYLTHQKQQLDVIRYVAWRIEKANAQAPALSTFASILPIIGSNHGMSISDQLGTEPSGIPTTGVEAGVILPSERYQFSAERAAIFGEILDSSMTMAALKPVLDNSNAASNPVALTPSSVGWTLPAILATNGVTVKELKCLDKPYVDKTDASMEVTLEKVDVSGRKDTFTTTFKLHAIDGPYDFRADEALFKNLTGLTIPTMQGTMNASGDASTMGIVGEPTTLSAGTTVTYTITGVSANFGIGETLQVKATLTNGSWTHDVPNLPITTV